MAHRAAPKIAERMTQHEIRVVEATEETLRGYGRIERDFPSAKIEIVRWPAQGWRPVDPDTGERVPYGQPGQVVMNHLSKGMFIPNNLERDLAIRMPGPAGELSDSVSEVRPVTTFEGEPVIEGVY